MTILPHTRKGSPQILMIAYSLFVIFSDHSKMKNMKERQWTKQFQKLTIDAQLLKLAEQPKQPLIEHKPIVLACDRLVLSRPSTPSRYLLDPTTNQSRSARSSEERDRLYDTCPACPNLHSIQTWTLTFRWVRGCTEYCWRINRSQPSMNISCVLSRLCMEYLSWNHLSIASLPYTF